MKNIEYEVLKHPLAPDDNAWYMRTNIDGLFAFLMHPVSFVRTTVGSNMPERYFITFDELINPPRNGGRYDDFLIAGIEGTSYLSLYLRRTRVSRLLRTYLEEHYGASLQDNEPSTVTNALCQGIFGPDLSVDILVPFNRVATHVELLPDVEAQPRAALGGYLHPPTFSTIMLSRPNARFRRYSGNGSVETLDACSLNSLVGGKTPRIVVQGVEEGLSRSNPLCPPGTGCVPGSYPIDPDLLNSGQLVGTLQTLNTKTYPCRPLLLPQEESQ